MNDVSQRNEQVALWALRALWIGLPITLGPLLATKLDPVDLPGRSVLSVGLWLLWGLGFFSTLLPRPATLTAVRFGSAALIGLIIFAAGPALDASLVAGAINVLAALLISASAPLGGVFVDGVSYGDERRFLLRAPALVAILLRPLALIAGVVGLFTGPWLLANRHLISGFIFFSNRLAGSRLGHAIIASTQPPVGGFGTRRTSASRPSFTKRTHLVSMPRISSSRPGSLRKHQPGPHPRRLRFGTRGTLRHRTRCMAYLN